MTNSWMQRALMVLVFAAAGSSFADVTDGVDPGYVKVKVYEFRVAKNADCSNGIEVYRTASPAYEDLTHNPTLGSGTIPDGTYNCVMMRMSDNLRFTASVQDSLHTCTPGVDSTTDVGHDDTAVDPDGTQHPLGPAGTENIVWLYIRTNAPTGQNTNAFAPTGGIPLTSPLVVSGDTAHTMVFDFSGRIGDDHGACSCDAPTLGFR